MEPKIETNKQSSYQIPLEDIKKVAEELDKLKIDPLNFRGFKKEFTSKRGEVYVEDFSDTEIIQDLTKLQETKGEIKKGNVFETKSKEDIDGLIMEGVFIDCVKNGGILGKNSTIHKASEFDDVFNKIDAFVEFKKRENDERASQVAFSFDFTTNAKEARDKIAFVLGGLTRGQMSTIKYFESPEMGKRKNFRVPKIVLCYGGQDVEKVVVDYIRLKKEGFDTSNTLRENGQVLYSILGQIKIQLQAFANICHDPKIITNQEKGKKMGGFYYKTLKTFLREMAEVGISEQAIDTEASKDPYYKTIYKLVESKL